MGEITYDDIKRLFSEEDLAKYDWLCGEFVKITHGKNNTELWDMVQSPSKLTDLHRKISELERGFTGEFTMTDFETHAKESKTPMKKREGT